jgi:hypothetical protein
VDFIVPQNTPVLAAVDGEMLFISDNSNAGGLDPLYWNKLTLLQLSSQKANILDMIIWNIIVQK